MDETTANTNPDTNAAADPRSRIQQKRSVPGSLAAAFAGATLVPFLVGGAAGAVVEAALSLFVRQQRIGTVLAIAALTVAYAIVATGVFSVALRGLVREALEGLSWQGRWEWLRWRERVGRKIPTTPGGLRSWLDETSDRPDLDLERIEPLVFLRRYDDAVALAEHLPQDSAWMRFERRVLIDWIDFIRTGRADIETLRQLAAEISDPEERLHADAMVSTAEARRLLAYGGATDWLRPLADFRRRLGVRAKGILWREYVPGRFRAYVLVGLILALTMQIGLPLS
jgi:hypothetical protein